MPKQKSLHPKVAKRRKGWRRKGIFWEYNEDGRFRTEKLDKFFKRYWRKWQRRTTETEEE